MKKLDKCKYLVRKFTVDLYPIEYCKEKRKECEYTYRLDECKVRMLEFEKEKNENYKYCKE